MRIVVKIGTSTLAHPTGHLNIRRVEQLCKVMSDIKNAGHEVILVSSGAIGMGVGKLGLRERPKDIPTKQAAAAVGQCELMYTYDKLFGEYNHTVAQLLITREDIANEVRHFNFSNTAKNIASADFLRRFQCDLSRGIFHNFHNIHQLIYFNILFHRINGNTHVTSAALSLKSTDQRSFNALKHIFFRNTIFLFQNL